MKDVVEEWVKQAKDELDMAVYLLQGGYFKGACYHAQQSVEKAMKAAFLKKGGTWKRPIARPAWPRLGKTFG